MAIYEELTVRFAVFDDLVRMTWTLHVFENNPPNDKAKPTTKSVVRICIKKEIFQYLSGFMCPYLIAKMANLRLATNELFE